MTGLRGFGLSLRPVFEAPAFVAGFDDFAMVGKPVKQCCCHFGIPKDTGPFPEGEVGGDDDRSAFVELADQMEQKLAAGLGEGQITQLIEDQEVEPGDEIGGSALPFCAGFGVKLVHQIDDIEEAAPAPGPDAGAGDADCKMGFASACPTDQHEVALMIQEVSRGQVADQRLVDLGRLKIELFQLLGQRQFGDGHLVFDRPGLLLADFGGQQIADDLLRLMLAFDGGGQDLVIGGSHPVELQLSHRVYHVGSFHLSVSSGCHIGCSRQLAHRPVAGRPGW